MMFAYKHGGAERPRELRRRIVLPVRVRTGAAWSDACILNISSRGLMLRSGSTLPEGSCVQVRRGDHVIVARVVWKDGSRVGLQSDERVPVEEIMSLSRSTALQLVASDGAVVERRRQARPEQLDARLRGRAFEFLGIGAFGAALSLGLWAIAQQVLAAPIAQVEAALEGQPAAVSR